MNKWVLGRRILFGETSSCFRLSFFAGEILVVLPLRVGALPRALSPVLSPETEKCVFPLGTGERVVG